MKNFLLAGISVFSFGISAAQADTKPLPVIRLCTGLQGLNYFWTGQEIAKQAKNILDIKVIPTKGSLENLAKLASNDCDVAIVQSDALNAVDKVSNVEVGPALYKEYWHLICNTDANISRITGLNKDTKILLGANGGGAEVTWTSLVKSDPKRYSVVPHDPIGGLRAAGIVQQGSQAACMAVVTGLNSAGIKEINEIAKQSNNMRLIASNDGDILNVKDPKGHLVYTNDSIPSGTYAGGLQPSSLFGSSVDTVSVNALIVSNSDFIDANEGVYTQFLRAVNNAVPGIKEHMTVR